MKERRKEESRETGEARVRTAGKHRHVVQVEMHAYSSVRMMLMVLWRSVLWVHQHLRRRGGGGQQHTRRRATHHTEGCRRRRRRRIVAGRRRH